MDDAPVLRPYQVDAVEALRTLLRRGMRRIVLQGQTGSGKNVVSAEIIRATYAKGGSATFWAHSREIVEQMSGHLWDFGVPHAVIMSGEDYDGIPARVTVCSKDTLLSRACRRKVMDMPPADVLIVDESHRSLGAGYQRLLEHYKDKVVIGPSATPCRKDGRSMKGYYDGLVQIVQPSQLILEGYLVPTKVFAPHRPDLSDIPRFGADFDPQALQKKFDKPTLVGNVIEHWLRLGENRQTVVFATGVRHSIHLKDQFLAAGVVAEHLDNDTPQADRKAILKRLESGETRVVCNVGVLQEGWDCPPVGCVCMVCPTQSFVKFRQCCGRMQRPWPGKEYAILLDHAGVVYQFGFPDDDIEWKLTTASMHTEVKKRLADGKMKTPICCPSCHCLFSGKPNCPNCGHRMAKTGKTKVAEQGLLIDVGGVNGTVNGSSKPGLTQEDKQRIWLRFLGVTAKTGSTLGAAARMYNQKTGEMPWQNTGLSPLPPPGQQYWSMHTADMYPGFATGKKKKQP